MLYTKHQIVKILFVLNVVGLHISEIAGILIHDNLKILHGTGATKGKTDTKQQFYRWKDIFKEKYQRKSARQVLADHSLQPGWAEKHPDWAEWPNWQKWFIDMWHSDCKIINKMLHSGQRLRTLASHREKTVSRGELWLTKKDINFHH